MKLSTSLLLPFVALLTLTSGAHAQGPGGFGGPGGGGMPPAAQAKLQAKMQAWRQWRDTHQNVASLQRTLGAMTRLEEDPQTKLTKPQARAVLAVIKKWQTKPALSDAQARLVNTQLTLPLTLVQIKQIAMAGQGRRRGYEGGGFGGGGFGGGRPGGGFDPASLPAPRDYNPLNPSTQPMARARDRGRQQHARLLAALTAAAK